MFAATFAMNDLALGSPSVIAASERTILDVIRCAASTRGVQCDNPGGDARLVRLRRGEDVRLVHADGCCNESHVSVAIARHASVLRTFLLEAGMAVPNVLVATHADDAVNASIVWSGPVVVASIDMQGRAGAMARLDSPSEIRAAFIRAAVPRGRAVIIGPLNGDDYRVLVVNGIAVTASRCQAPRVTGDGASTIADLIARANAQDDSQRHAEIPCDAPTELALARQGLTLESTVRAGRSVALRDGCDHRAGGRVEDVTNAMSSEVARECESAARLIGLDVAEVSVACEDISRPLASQRGCIVGVDPSPDVAIHHAADGTDTHAIGAALMELLFPEA